MPYKVRLTTVGGQRTEFTEIERDPTPNVGDTIFVGLGTGGSTKAKVTSIHRQPSASPGSAVELVDLVDAQEL